MMQVENPRTNTSIFYDAEGPRSARHLDFFMDRYAESYLLELNAFIQALQTNTPMPITGQDGLRAMILALAANLSVKENRPVKPTEIYVQDST